MMKICQNGRDSNWVLGKYSLIFLFKSKKFYVFSSYSMKSLVKSWNFWKRFFEPLKSLTFSSLVWGVILPPFFYASIALISIYTMKSVIEAITSKNIDLLIHVIMIFGIFIILRPFINNFILRRFSISASYQIQNIFMKNIYLFIFLWIIMI